MSRFAGVLRQVSDGLDLPQPTKSRILLEMGSDLEDAYRHHLEQGLSEEEAVRRAEDAFAVSDEALRHLAHIHLSGGQLADRLLSQIGSLWAKVLLVMWLLAALAIAGRVATTESFFEVVSPFLWPILGLAIATFAFSLWKLYELLRPSPDFRRLRLGLGTLLFIAAFSLAVSACGFFYHLRSWAYQSYETEAEFWTISGHWTLAVSSMMVLGLLTAVLASLAWFVLAALAARVENRQADALLAT